MQVMQVLNILIYYNIIIYTIYIRLKLYKLEVSTRMRIRYALIHTRVLRASGIFIRLLKDCTLIQYPIEDSTDYPRYTPKGTPLCSLLRATAEIGAELRF